MLTATRLLDWPLGDTLASRQLVQVLPDWSISSADVNVVFPANRHLPERVRASVDFAVKNLPEIVLKMKPAAG